MNPWKLVPVVAVLASACLAPAGASAGSAEDGKRKAPAQLEIDSLRVGTREGPLAVRVRAGTFAKVAVWVNGRRVRHPFEYAGRHAQAIELRTADGLRAGLNRLRIQARSGGRVAVAKRTLRLQARLLHADAGPDAGVTARVSARLGSKPHPSAPAGLAYRWQIVQRPPGAKATLRFRDAPRPLLRAEHPGTYELQLETSTPEGPPSFDQITVPVAPPDPPIGAPIDTITPSGAISIGDRAFGANAGGIAYVVVERTTRQPVRNADNSEVAGSVGNDAAGIAKLAELAHRYAEQNYMKYLMIVSGRSGIPAAQQGTFAQMLKDLGVARLDPLDFAALERGGQFSVIGIPGAPYGSGTVRAPSLFFPATSGALIGYLQKSQTVNVDGTPVYDFAAPEHPSFDTRAESSEQTNKMVVDGIEYAAALSDGATAGFHVVVLESLTLKPLDNLVVATNGSGGSDRARQAAAATALKNALDRRGGPTVLVQSIGKPKGAGPEWDGVVEQLARLGANRLLVYALDGTSEYALAGRLGSEQPPAESSNAYDHGPYAAPQYPAAHLIGVLSRTRDSHFEPTVSSTPTAAGPEGGVNLRLIKVAYRDPEPWPQLAPLAKAGEEAAVQQFVCEQLGFCKPEGSCQKLRDCYWDSYNDVDWDTKLTLLTSLEYPGKGKGFEADTLSAAKKVLKEEIGAVADVHHYIQRIQEPFLQSEAKSYVDLKTISKQVWDSVQQPAPDNSTSWTLGLVGKLVLLGHFAGPPVGGLSSALSAVFGLSAYVSNKQGTPILGGEIEAKAGELGEQVFERINAAARTATGLGKLIVSDHGKLMEVERHLGDSSWKLPDPENALIPLKTASKQWFYEALVPTAYPYLIRGGGLNARTIDCQRSDRLPWPRQPDEDQMVATTGYDGGGSPIHSVFFFTTGIGGGSNPPPTLGQAMFRPREAAQSGLGMEKLQFFTPKVFGGKIAHAVNGVPMCRLGWLPAKY
jgi:hypothetical protein